MSGTPTFDALVGDVYMGQKRPRVGPPFGTPDIHAWHTQMAELKILESTAVPPGRSAFVLAGPAGSVAWALHPWTFDEVLADGNVHAMLDLSLERQVLAIERNAADATKRLERM